MSNLKVYKAMTIAGSDTSGGAGMEADLKTFEENKVYGTCALTCIVAQHPEDWFHEIIPLDIVTIEKQLNTILGAIGCDAMKTGMLGSADLVELVARTIDKYELKNVVIDPVMVCKGIDAIMVPEAAAAIKELLIKRADLMTPNLLEAAYLSDMEAIKNIDDMKEAASIIVERGAKYVAMKAGDRFGGDKAIDLLYDGKDFKIFEAPLIKDAYNHGAGCTFSASMTANLAKGKTISEAMENTQAFMQKALGGSFAISKFGGATRPWAHSE